MRYIRVLLLMLITQMFILSCGQLRVDGSQNPIVSTTPTLMIDSIPTETQISNSESINSLGNTLKTDMIFNVENYDKDVWNFFPIEKNIPSDLEILDVPTNVYSIAFSPDGTVWVGSFPGLWNYKNNRWSSVLKRDGLLSNNVDTVSMAPNGDMWIGARDGVSYFDGKSWKTFQLEMAYEVAASPGGTAWVIHVINSEDGRDHGTVSFYDTDGWHSIFDEASAFSPTSLTVALDGTVWIGTWASGIIRANQNSIMQYGLDTFSIHESSGGNCGLCVSAIEMAPDGHLWAIKAQSGIVHFDGETWVTYPYYTEGKPTSLAISKENRVWIGELLGNVVAYKEKDQWYTFSDLPFSKVYDIEIASDGAVWFGTEKGIYLYEELAP